MIKLLLSLLYILLVSCKNDIKDIDNIVKKYDLPQYISEYVDIYHVDSGSIKAFIKAKKLIIKKYEDSTIREFPEGVIAYFYNSKKEVKLKVKSNYAYYNSKYSKIELKDSVVAINKNNDSLFTHMLIFDNKENRVYSDTVVTIFKKNQYWKGSKGFESDINFNEYKIKKTFGKVKSIYDD